MNAQNAPLIAVCVTIIVAIGGLVAQAIHSARKFGRFESEHDLMKTDIRVLKDDSVRHGAIGTSVQLLSQAVGALTATITEMRTETREGRQEMRDAVSELKTETREAIAEVRQDIRTSVRRPN